MVANPRDEGASSPWPRPRFPPSIRSCPTRDLTCAGAGPFNKPRPPHPRRLVFERLCDSRDVLGGISTTTAGDVDQPSPRKVAEITSPVLRAQVEAGFRQ